MAERQCTVERMLLLFVTVASAPIACAHPRFSHRPSTRFRIRQTRPFALRDPRRAFPSRLPSRKLCTRVSPSVPVTMQQLVTMVTNPLSRLVSFVVAYLAIGTPLRRFFIPFLGRPTGLRGSLLARFVLPVLNRPMVDLVLSAACPAPDARVLELGFANGDVLQRLLDDGLHPPVFGLDISPDMVVLARARLEKNAVLGGKDVQEKNLVRDGMTYSELFDEEDCVRAGLNPQDVVARFDVMLFINVFYFFSDTGIHVAARNLWALVKEGGRIVTVARETIEDEVREGFAALGFGGDLSNERYINAMREAGFEVNVDKGGDEKLIAIVATKAET